MSVAIDEQIDPRLQIGAVHLAVADLQRSVDFYTSALGLALISRGQDAAILGASHERPLVQLTHLQSPTPLPLRSTGLFHVALLHPSRGDLASTVLRLAEAGWPITGASDHGVSEAIYLDDPDGLGLEIYADRSREQWPAPTGADSVAMYTAPLALDSLLASAAAPTDTIAPGTVVGHVHLKVADLERSVAFYRDGLGLALRAQMPSAAFLAADGYHHHVGLNTWQSLGAAPAPSSSPGLRLFELELTSSAALEAVRRRLAARTTTVLQGDGRSLALHDPDGHALAVDLGARAGATRG